MIKNYLKLLIVLVFATNVMAQNVPSYVPKDGLLGWWPFNENANDESGNGNHGKVSGATLSNDRNGKANSAYSFDGIDDFIKCSYSGPSGNSDVTVMFWTKKINNTLGEVFGYGDNGINNSDFRIYFKSGNCSNESISFDTYMSVKTIKDINTNNWDFYTIVYDSQKDINTNAAKIYKNSILIEDICFSSNSGSTNFSKLLPITFGRYHGTVEKNYYSGVLDDFAIYGRILSDQEIKQVYEGYTKETATSNSFNSYAFTNNSSINLSATPSGGTFSGEAVTNNAFNPSKAKLGKNQVKYNFKNSTGCADSTNFEMIMVDTLGNKCTETIYDTIKVKESTYDTLKIKVQLTTGIKAGQIATMNVYPNPTSDVVIIEASDVVALNGYSYKMVDLQGKQVYKELVTKAKTEISLKSIGAKGVYILHILDAQGVSIENKKIVLE